MYSDVIDHDEERRRRQFYHPELSVSFYDILMTSSVASILLWSKSADVVVRPNNNRCSTSRPDSHMFRCVSCLDA